MKRFVFFLSVLIMLPAAPVQAEIMDLTWSACLASARVGNQDLQAAQAELEQAKQDVTLAYAGLYPQLSIGASANKFSSQESLTDPAQSSADLSFKQLLFDGFQTSAQAQAAKLRLEQAKASFQTTAAALRYELRQAYIDFLENLQGATLGESIEKQRQQNLNLVKLRYQGGREHAGALKSSEADLAQAQFETRQAKRNLTLAQQQLARLLGKDLDQYFSTSETLETLEITVAEADIKKLVTASPQYRTQQYSRDVAQKKQDQANGAFWPTLNLNAGTGLSSNDWPAERADWSASLSLDFALFDGGSRSAQALKSSSVLKQAELELRSSYETLWTDLSSKWIALQDTQETIAVKQKYLEAKTVQSKISNAEYSNGMISFEDWSSIEDSLATARKTRLEAQANLSLAHAKWQQLIGVDFNHE